MFSDKHYVPAIKWRQGEYGALEDLRTHHKAELTPLVDVPPTPWDFAEERPTKSIDAHTARMPIRWRRHGVPNGRSSWTWAW